MTAVVTRRPPAQAAIRRARVAPRTTGLVGALALQRAVTRSLAGVSQRDFRPDVEGLRALAVVAVVAFHVQLGGFGGGFVGVDVFFVLSGFLITRLLLHELEATGTISLRGFWARRARRLLPASCLVLVATVVAGRFLLAPLAQRDLAVDATASGGFVVNFVFADRLGDYFGAQLGEAAPSPLLHFWSLALEEQFYLVWPLILLLATRRPLRYRRVVISTILLVGAASFLVSAWLTDVRPTWGFYLLPARMGELLAGAALAAAGPAFLAVSARRRAAAGWLGILGIVVAVVTYDDSMAFPGTATLLPVLSTVLVIVAGGAGAHAVGPGAVLKARPLQWTGRHSYAIYLWHWPALVLVEARWGPLPMTARLAVVAGAVGLAALSVWLLEDPVRHSRWLAARPPRGLTLGAALCALAMITGAVSFASGAPLATDSVAAAPVLAAPVPATTVTTAPQVGPAALAAAPAPIVLSTTSGVAPPVSVAALTGGDLASLLLANQAVLEQGLATTDVPSNLRPSLATANGDRAPVYADGCVAIGVDTAVTPCRYGDPASPTTVVLYGDSHAAQWSPAFIELAGIHGFQLVVLAKGGCPTAAVDIPTATLQRTCPIWRDAAIDLIAGERPDLVVVSAWSGYPNTDDEWAAGFGATMARLAPATDRLVVLGDNPPARDEPAACLSAHVRQVDACTATPDRVVATGRVAVERSVAEAHAATFVDTTPWLCAPAGCPVIIGDVLLFRDRTHLTTVAASWFRPLLEASLLPVLSAPPA